MERTTALKEVLTTGQVARICNVTIRTVIKWFESGRLPGYKIPESKDRRIPKENLRDFLREHKIPHDPRLFDARPRLLIADDDPEILDMLRRVFERSGRIDVQTATSGWEAGFATARTQPDVLLIDYNLGDATATDVLATLHDDSALEDTQVICMTGYLTDAEVVELEKTGLRVIRKPLDFAALEAEVTELLHA